jgi:hypothetical protein
MQKKDGPAIHKAVSELAQQPPASATQPAKPPVI